MTVEKVYDKEGNELFDYEIDYFSIDFLCPILPLIGVITSITIAIIIQML